MFKYDWSIPYFSISATTRSDSALIYGFDTTRNGTRGRHICACV